MKKILVILLLLIQMVLFAPKVNAVSFSTSMSGASTINAGSTFTVNINVSTSVALYSFESSYSYDNTKLSFKSASCNLPGCGGVTIGASKLNLDSATGKSGPYLMLSLTFTAKAAFTAGQSTVISISGVSGSIGTSDILGSSSSRTITVAVPKSSNNNLSALSVDGTSVPSFSASTTSYNVAATDKASISIGASVADGKASVSGTGTKNLIYGANSFPITVTAENGAAKTYTVKITRNDPRSTDNFLSAITLSAGELTFNKDTGAYTVVVENTVTSITIGGTVADAKSVLTGPGTYELKVYSNVFVLSVTAENQTVRTYSVDIVRKDELGFSRELSNDNALATLSIEGIAFPFTPETTNYVLNVDTALASVNIAATVRNALATVVFPTTATLDFGQNVVNITVTAENGEKKIYTLFIYRKSEAPIVGIDAILATLDTTTSKSVILIPGISGIIPKAVLDKAAEKGITLIVEKKDELGRVIYVWTFVGAAADTRTNIDTKLSFTSTDEELIRSLSNYADGMILNFSHSGPIVAGTSIKIYVGARFVDGLKLNLYLFNKDSKKLSLSVKEVEVKNGFIELTMTHASQYLLTRATMKDTSIYSVLFIVSVVEAALLLSLLIYLGLRRKRKTT